MVRPLLALLLALSLSGCTVGQTRVSFGVAMLADAGTTQYALQHGYHENNPLMGPHPILYGTLAAVSLAGVAEYLSWRGDKKAAAWVYGIGSVAHFSFAGWNAAQLWKNR